jgi:hypothetical protein
MHNPLFTLFMFFYLILCILIFRYFVLSSFYYGKHSLYLCKALWVAIGMKCAIYIKVPYLTLQTTVEWTLLRRALHVCINMPQSGELVNDA